MEIDPSSSGNSYVCIVPKKHSKEIWEESLSSIQQKV